MSSASVTAVVDLEAQSSIHAPTPAITHITRSPPSHPSPNPIDSFYSFSSSRTHESRHDLSVADVPPPYVDDLPPYSEKAPEPLTLAKYLFMFGFCTCFLSTFRDERNTYPIVHSVSTILDHGCMDPLVASAGSQLRWGCGVSVDAREDRGRAQENHRGNPRSRG